MTAQRHDYLLVDGERRRIAAAAPMPFAPNAFGLRADGSPDLNCCRGFWVDFKIDGDILKIFELWLAPNPGDRESLLHGACLNRAPDDVSESSMIFRDISLPYSGKLMVDGRAAPEFGVPQDVHEVFRFEEGRLQSREKVNLQKLPEEYTPSSVWVDYGIMLWILPESSDVEAS